MAKPYGLANQRLCYIWMLHIVEKSGEQDKECSKEKLVNSEYGPWSPGFEPHWILVGVSLGKTLQSPSQVLVRPRKDMNNVNCCHDKTEILLKGKKNTNQSIKQNFTLPCTENVIRQQIEGWSK